MFTRSAIILALSAVAFGKVFITEPIASTSWAAGTPQTVQWHDDGTVPTLETFGPAKISIYVGNAQAQTLLQTITPSLDVSTAESIEFTPDPKIGPNGNAYFIRFESISLKDPAGSTVPALSFSAKFTLTGMTGTFTPEVQAQINGASTAPIGGTPATPAIPSSSAAPPAVPSAPAPRITTTSSSVAAAAKPTSTPATGTAGANAAKPSGGASSLKKSGFVVAAAAAAIGVALC